MEKLPTEEEVDTTNQSVEEPKIFQGKPVPTPGNCVYMAAPAPQGYTPPQMQVHQPQAAPIQPTF